MIDRTPEGERLALDDMLSSDGWAIYMEHVAAAWGHEACETALRKARLEVDVSEWPFESARILDTFSGIRADLRWPEERVRALKAAEKAAKPRPADVFDKFRRRPIT